jgi:hypothetical protein
MESFIDPGVFRSMDLEYYHPDEIIENFFNVNYALGYEYGVASVTDTYVEDVQQFERNGMFYFHFSEQAIYYPDKVTVDPNREEKLTAVYNYFIACDKIQKLIKQQEDGKNISNK